MKKKVKNNKFLSTKLRSNLIATVKDFIIDMNRQDSEWCSCSLDNGFIGFNNMSDDQILAEYYSNFSCIFDEADCIMFKKRYDEALAEKEIYNMVSR